MNSEEREYTFLGFFADKGQEEIYQQSTFKKNLSQIQPLFLFTGIIFALLFLTDLSMVAHSKNYWLLGFFRIFFLLLSIFFYLKRPNFFTPKKLNHTLTIYIGLGILFLLIIYITYQPIYFTSTSYGLLSLLLYLFFIIPLPIGTKNLLAFIAIIGFVGISVLIHKISIIIATSFTLFSLLAILFFNYIIIHFNHIQRERFVTESKLAVLNKKDPLTGFANRLKFNEFLDEFLRFTRRYRTPLTLILLELQGLQNVQNKDGQEAGDNVLKEFAHFLVENTREVDFLARVGGVEFTLLLPNTTVEGASSLIRRLEELFESDFSYAKKGIRFYYGLTPYEEKDTFISFIKKADTALFLTKKKRREK